MPGMPENILFIPSRNCFYATDLLKELLFLYRAHGQTLEAPIFDTMNSMLVKSELKSVYFTFC